jgi:glutamine amidotransferase
MTSQQCLSFTISFLSLHCSSIYSPHDPILLHPPLTTHLPAQDPRRPHNGDGFGVGYYTTHPSLGPSPCLFTSTTPAWNCINLSRLAAKTTSPLIFAHVRATTSGALSSTNCHPFRHNALMWMHNGNIACWHLVKRDLALGLRERWFLGVLGGTDSEWAFAVFLDEMERGGVDPSEDPGPGGFGHGVLRKAMLKTIARINALVEAIPTERLAGAEELETRSLLNFAVTDGHSVVCTRYVSSRTDEAASLYWSSGTSWREVGGREAEGREGPGGDAAGEEAKKAKKGWSENAEREEKRFVMERRDRGADIVLVASEPLTFERGTSGLDISPPYHSLLELCSPLSHIVLCLFFLLPIFYCFYIPSAVLRLAIPFPCSQLQ